MFCLRLATVTSATSRAGEPDDFRESRRPGRAISTTQQKKLGRRRRRRFAVATGEEAWLRAEQRTGSGRSR